MNESGFWSKVAAAFNDRKHARAKKLHAGMFDDGLPDGAYVVDGVQGYLELKYVPAWPKRPGTPVTCSLTVPQRSWLEDWVRSTGRAHVLLGIEKEWFLLEIHEVPDDNRLTRFALAAIRAQGRHGTLKSLGDLPEILARTLAPVID